MKKCNKTITGKHIFYPGSFVILSYPGKDIHINKCVACETLEDQYYQENKKNTE